MSPPWMVRRWLKLVPLPKSPASMERDVQTAVTHHARWSNRRCAANHQRIRQCRCSGRWIADREVGVMASALTL